MTNLFLIPTPHELAILRPLLDETVPRADWAVELCGFGPIAAAARTSLLIAQLQPRRVLLAGIAGTYVSRLAVGSAAIFRQVACYGVGAGTGDDHRTAGSLGWPQWRALEPPQSIGDEIVLATDDAADFSDGGQLLTCCAASATLDDVRCRTRAFPQATAEDMEGFGVALACEMAAIPLTIVRGISNLAGDRDQENWHVKAALRAVAKLTANIMAEE